MLLCTLMLSTSCANAQKKIGVVDRGTPVLQTDQRAISTFLLSSGYASIESINIAADGELFVLQIIAVSKNGTRELLAKKLVNDGGNLLLGGENAPDDLMFKHTCTGNPYSNCDFTGTFDIGCKCGKEATGKCNHTISSDLSFTYPDFYKAVLPSL